MKTPLFIRHFLLENICWRTSVGEHLLKNKRMSIRLLEQSHMDLKKIPPLDANRITGFVNHFAINLIKVSFKINLWLTLILNLILCLKSN